MSYDIVKGIRIDEKAGTVTVKAAASNVFPKTFEWWKSPSLGRILREKGRKALEKEILLQYWNGNFQKSDNAYDKTVAFWKWRLPYTWNNTGSGDELGTEKWGHKVEHTYDQVAEALHEKFLLFKKRRKGHFYIQIDKGYVMKITTRFTRWCEDIRKAKRFGSREEATVYAMRSMHIKNALGAVKELK